MRSKKKHQARAFSIAASFLMTFSLLVPGVSHAELSNNKLYQSFNDSNKTTEVKVSDRLLTEFKNDEKVTFLVKFKETAEVEKVAFEAKKSANEANLSAQRQEHIQRSAVIAELKSTALTSQQNVKKYVKQEVEKGNADSFNSYHIVNGMAVTATKEVAEKIAAFAEVEKILPNETRELYTTVSKDAKAPESEIANVEWNVERVGAPAVWNMGFDGTGTVVASIDTGVDWDHPALMEKYRGFDAATGEADHTYSWFDATAGREEPYDDQGHGTHVTGTMVGSEADGSNQIGVAPGAKFIAVKAFTADGGTDADLLDAAQWIMAPGGDATKAPDVVNNSWGGGPGLDEWYRDVVIAWRAADIFPEFSAGNTTFMNPGGPGSIATPANYPESFATGATDINDNLASFSLEGPSPYEGDIKPDISAPGVNIRSSVPGGGYEGGWNGTSMAGPAVSAVAALLIQADSSLSVDELEDIMLNTAMPLTDTEYPEAPNMGYGYGLVNAYDAVSSLVTGLGNLAGQVTEEGEDTEAPDFEHDAPVEIYEGMDLDLSLQVSDNVRVDSVEVIYGDGKSVEALRVAGDSKSGEYAATIPGEDIAGDIFNYHFVINDFGNNEVTSDDYVIAVHPGITVGYFEDFEATPAGWTSYGMNNYWEWGKPTFGPDNAYSGENVYGTNLDGGTSLMSASNLGMPPIDLPEGESYLQFKQWYSFYMVGDIAVSLGYIRISTDQENWTRIGEFGGDGDSNGWINGEISLSQYAGQRVYIEFEYVSLGNMDKPGWYLDDVALSDTANSNANQLGILLPKNDKNSLKNTKVDDILGTNNTKEKQPKDNNKELETKVKNNNSVPGKVDSQTKESKTKNRSNETNTLPLAASVSVLESGRSVNTDPADGTYTMSHAAGDYTAVAEAYGFHSEEQSVTINSDGTTEANFILEEIDQYTVNGTITNEATGEPVEGATVMLVEDANVDPVTTDSEGNFTLTAYEGTYTLRVVAAGYHRTEVEFNLDGEDTIADSTLEPLYTIPGGEIGYDDGTFENGRIWNEAGNGWAVKMSLPEGEESAIVTDGVFKFHDTFPIPGGTGFAVEVWDATGPDGMPGEKLAGPIEAEANRSLDEWTVVDLTGHSIQVDGDFYMVYIQTGDNSNVPGLASDQNGPNAERSYQVIDGLWSQAPVQHGNFMIRARVSYEVEEPLITSPAKDLITNESEITVKGTASDQTSLQLLNNGEEVATVEIGEDETFSIPTELTEGENEFTAVTLLDGNPTAESEPVTVTLDTEEPELTIDSPVDGDNISRETVTVEGTVADTNLDYVEVNGQEAEVTDGNYSKRILLDEGENNIEVVASDLAGNSTKELVTIDVDFTAPGIENLIPTKDVYIKAGESVKFEFDSEPGLRATYFIRMPLTNTMNNFTELPMMETYEGHYVGYWTATSNALAEGAVIEVKVRDDFGNETREEAEGKLFINIE
ncbi:S8 family peptidase [Virgibacillus oceani]|uniref:Bacillopeptidase F n=1 Tax=Virgibacillus oceani TaxID=1479511 RepID=A0A917HB19_9BACI|nr:S8 family peptidase [Virgibacillus oceani]GGG73839.1 bacillopeptidase F [Virgibacillus oceani]